MEITDKMIEAGMKLLGHSTPNKYDEYLVRAIFTAMLDELHGEFFAMVDDPEEGSTSVEDIVDRTADGEFVHIDEHITLRRRVYARLVAALRGKLSPSEQIAAVCRQIRARDALWRADPPGQP